MEGVQHAVADEPVRARRLELRIGAVAIERAVEFARQFALHLQKRRVAFKRNRRHGWPACRFQSLAAASARSLHYLYIVKIIIQAMATAVKRNLYSVKIMSYKRAMARKSESIETAPPRAPGAASGKSRRHKTSRRNAKAPAKRALPSRRAASTPCSRRPNGCWNATGSPGLTLRAVAREAGVSHAAPTHHFGDLTGLVSELAAIGFRQFNAAMVAAGSVPRPDAGESAGAGARPMSPMRRPIPACTD